MAEAESSCTVDKVLPVMPPTTDWVWEGDIHPLLIPTVLSRIFPKLRSMDKRNCRRVCKLWNKMPMTRPSSLKYGGGVKFEILTNVKKFMKDMADGAFEHIRFTEFRFMRNSLYGSSRFFRENGEQIKGLELDAHVCSATFDLDVVVGLLREAPNVEWVELYNFGMPWGRTVGVWCGERVENLERLSISYSNPRDPNGHSAEIIPTLFGMMTCLESLFLGVPPEHLLSFCRGIIGIQTIRALDIETHFKGPEAAAALKDAAFQLEHFAFKEDVQVDRLNDGTNFLSPEMSAFLSLQSRTLNTLHMKRCRHDYNVIKALNIDAPLLPNLTSLALEMGVEQVHFRRPPVSTFPSLRRLEVRLSAAENINFIFEGFQEIEILILVEIGGVSNHEFNCPDGFGEVLAGYNNLPLGEYPVPYPFGVPITDPDQLCVIVDDPPRASLRNLRRLKHFELVSNPVARCPFTQLNCFGALLALAQMKSLESVNLKNTMLRESTVRYLNTQIESVIIENNDSVTAETWNRCPCPNGRHGHYSQ